MGRVDGELEGRSFYKAAGLSYEIDKDFIEYFHSQSFSETAVFAKRVYEREVNKIKENLKGGHWVE